MTIIFTGGHHNSALEVAKELAKQKPEIKIIWLGHKHTMSGDNSVSAEYKEVTESEIEFKDLKAGKFYKTFNPLHWLRLPYGFIQSFFYLIKYKPKLVVSFGGYLAAPVVFAGWILQIPSVTHEQTVTSGLANHFIAKFAKKIFLTWESSAKYFNPEKTVVTGLPLRKEIFSPNFSRVKPRLTPPCNPTIYITGGKQGSHIINMAIKDSLLKILPLANIIHQTGSTTTTNDYNTLIRSREQLPKELKSRYEVKKYIGQNEIGEVFQKADLIISRAGAHITYELTALGKPVIFIPIPWSSHNEQTANAELLSSAGLARVIEQDELNGNLLYEEIKIMLKNLEEYKKAGEKTKEKIIFNATEKIVEEIDKII